MRDVPDGIDVLVPLDAQVLVDSYPTVLLEREAGFLEEVCGRGHAGTHDDQVCREWRFAFEVNRAAVCRVALYTMVRGAGLTRVYVPAGEIFSTPAFILNTMPCFFMFCPNQPDLHADAYLHDGRPDVPAQDRLERRLIHPDQSHTLRLLLQQRHRDLHPNETRADDDDLRLLRDFRGDSLGIVDGTEGEDALEIVAFDRDLLRLGTWSEDEVVIFDGGAGGGGDGLSGGIDFSDGLIQFQ